MPHHILKYDYKLYKARLFGKTKRFALFTFKTHLGDIVSELSTFEKLSMRTFDENLFQALLMLKNHTSFADILKQKNIYPSVFFLFQMAYDQYRLKGTKSDEIETAILIFDPAIEKIEKAYESGSRVFKLKLRSFTVERTLAFLKEVIERFPDIKLRLDHNQTIKDSSLFNFLENLPWNNIDFVEDPTFDREALLKAIQLYPGKLAIDESFRDSSEEFIDRNVNFVIKPLFTPHYHSLIEKLAQRGKRIIISSGFESQAGISYLKRLIHHYNLDDIHGLDTLKYYDEMPSL